MTATAPTPAPAPIRTAPRVSGRVTSVPSQYDKPIGPPKMTAPKVSGRVVSVPSQYDESVGPTPRKRVGASGSWDAPPPSPPSPPTPTTTRRTYVDIGHGLNNAVPGVYDPGNTAGGKKERKLLDKLMGDAGIDTNPDVQMVPHGLSLKERTEWAKTNRKSPDEPFVSFHLNSGGGHGALIIYSDKAGATEKKYAQEIALVVSEALGRPAKAVAEASIGRGQLAIPSSTGGGKAFIVELGYMDNPDDVAAIEERGAEAVRRVVQFTSGKDVQLASGTTPVSVGGR